MKKREISIPKYSLSEELINSISHGIGAGFAIFFLVILIVKATKVSPLAIVCSCIFGVTMILLYTMSCIYHALSPRVRPKKVLRVLDHCNVYLLVLGTYIPIALLGIGGAWGWSLFGFVSFITLLGIIFTVIDIDKFVIFGIVCHLLNGWSVLLCVKILLANIGFIGVLFLILGGIMYSVGAVLYAIGANKKYMHSIFHFFCLAGTLFHFLTVYFYVL